MVSKLNERAQETFCFYILDKDKHTVDFYPMSLRTVKGILKKAGKNIFSASGDDWSYFIGKWRDGTDSKYAGPAKYVAVATRDAKSDDDYEYIESIDKFIKEYGDQKTLDFWNSNYRNYYDMDKDKKESVRRRMKESYYDSPYAAYSSEDMADKICRLISRSEPFDEGTDEILTDMERFFGIDFGFSPEERLLDFDELVDDVFNELAVQPLDYLVAYYNNL